MPHFQRLGRRNNRELYDGRQKAVRRRSNTEKRVDFLTAMRLYMELRQCLIFATDTPKICRKQCLLPARIIFRRAQKISLWWQSTDTANLLIRITILIGTVSAVIYTSVTSGTETYRGFILDNVYHSEKDGDIHFNLYIPESYDGSKPYALFVSLPVTKDCIFKA